VGDLHLEFKFVFGKDLILLLLTFLAMSEVEVDDFVNAEIGFANGLFNIVFELSVSLVLSLLMLVLVSKLESEILEESRLMLVVEFDSFVGDVLAYGGDLLFRLDGGEAEPTVVETTFIDSHSFSS
jgi:hypothetical protein